MIISGTALSLICSDSQIAVQASCYYFCKLFLTNSFLHGGFHNFCSSRIPYKTALAVKILLFIDLWKLSANQRPPPCKAILFIFLRSAKVLSENRLCDGLFPRFCWGPLLIGIYFEVSLISYCIFRFTETNCLLLIKTDS